MQTILPIIPSGSTLINKILTVTKQNGVWTYYLSLWPMYSHKEEDQRSFRLICALLLNAGTCRQCDIVKTFGIHRRRLNRAQKQLRENGISSFFKKSKGRTGGHIFTSEIIRRAQDLLDQGLSRSEAAKEFGIDYSTFSKAISSKRLIEPEQENRTSTTQSQRALEDAQAAEEMGTACTQVGKRIAASFGLINGVETKFRKCLDVPNGGVLCALPALLEN
jgi:transposase